MISSDCRTTAVAPAMTYPRYSSQTVGWRNKTTEPAGRSSSRIPQRRSCVQSKRKRFMEVPANGMASGLSPRKILAAISPASRPCSSTGTKQPPTIPAPSMVS